MGLNIFIFLIVIIVAFLWFAAFVFYLKTGWSGAKNWVYFFISWVAINSLLWWIIVKPVLDCTGFLCGLEEVFMFLGLGVLTGLILGLIAYRKSRMYADKYVVKKSQEILDDTF